jgi:hypothetical protein
MKSSSGISNEIYLDCPLYSDSPQYESMSQYIRSNILNRIYIPREMKCSDYSTEYSTCCTRKVTQDGKTQNICTFLGEINKSSLKQFNFNGETLDCS